MKTTGRCAWTAAAFLVATALQAQANDMTMVLPIVAAPVLAAGMIIAFVLWIVARTTRVRTGILVGILTAGTLLTGIPGLLVAFLCIGYTTSRYANIAIPFLIGFAVYTGVITMTFFALPRRRLQAAKGAPTKTSQDCNEAGGDPPASDGGSADAAPGAGQSLAGHNEIPADIRSRHVSAWLSSLLFFGMMLGAMALITTDPSALAFAWLFPYGLCAILCAVLGSPQSEVLGHSLLFASFAVYIAMFVAFLRARTWIRLAVLCLILGGLLLLNVAGCRMTAGGISRIGN